MNESKSVPAFRSMPEVAEMNKTKGFDPSRFIRIAKDGGLVLDLKYKKMWFRVVYPEGKVRPVLLQKTNQVAVVEARVYRNVADTEPMAAFISTRYANGPEGKHYVDAAQYEAEDQALSDAGFGIQFCDVAEGTAMDRLVANGTVTIGASVKTAAGQPTEDEKPVGAPTPAVEQPVVVEQPVAAPPPVAVQPVIVESPVVAPAPVAEQPVATEQPVVTPPPVAVQSVVVEPPVVAPAPVVEQPVAAERPVAAPPPVAEQPMVEVQPSSAEPIIFPATQVEECQLDGKYTKDMPVEVICQTMTREEALAITVDVGKCSGWTLAQVEKERPASLKWYLNGYNGDNNIVRAGAHILLHGEQPRQVAV